MRDYILTESLARDSAFVFPKLRRMLRSWFGPSAGHPGTRHVVILEHSRDGYTLRPAAQPADQTRIGSVPG